MSQDAIRFHTIDSDSDLVAVAEVSLFSGVYLRGWYVYQRGPEIEVLPPHKVYQDPVTGEEKVWSILHFENEQTSRQWLERVKQEYLRWSRKGGSIAD
jgi:hypothetical protein